MSSIVEVCHTEQSINNETVEEFRSKSGEFLAMLFVNQYEIHDIPEIISFFIQEFGSKFDIIENKILLPIYRKINSVYQNLDVIKKSDTLELINYQDVIESIKINLDKLKDFDVYESSKSKKIRDDIAHAIKEIYLALNDKGFYEQSIFLASFNLTLVSSQSFIDKITRDIDALKENLFALNFIRPIDKLIHEKEYEKALKMIEANKVKYLNDNLFTELFIDRARVCILSYCKIKLDELQADPTKIDLTLNIISVLQNNIFLFNGGFEAAREGSIIIDRVISQIKSGFEKSSVSNYEVNISQELGAASQEIKKNIMDEIDQEIVAMLLMARFYHLIIHLKTEKNIDQNQIQNKSD